MSNSIAQGSLENNNSINSNRFGRSKSFVKENDSDIQLNEVFKKVFFHWPLYLLVLALSSAASFLFLRYSKPVYSSSARIYIQDQKKSGVSARTGGLEDLSLFGGSKLVENEMEVIKSPIILNDVIRDNRFNIRSFAKGRVSEIELYENLPLVLNFFSDSSKVGNHMFEMTLQRNGVVVKFIDQLQVEHNFFTNFNQQFVAGKDHFSVSYFPSNNPNKDQVFRIEVDSILQLAYSKAAQLSTVLVNKQASVFEMSYEDFVAKRAADFLNAVASKYNQYTLDDKNQTALNTIHFIDTRLNSLGTELGTIERDVESFKKTRGITEIEESSKLFLDRVKEADQKLDEANIQLSVYSQIEDYINNSSTSVPFTPVLGNVDPSLTALINKYQELLTEKKRLSLSLQSSNPIQENLNQQITDSRSTIRNYIAGFRRNAVTAKRGLQGKVNEIENKIAEIPSYERQFINLKRQQNVKEALYVYLLQKREESAVSSASNIVDNKIISPAFIPVRPIKPNRTVIILGFIFGSLIITSIYLYLKYSLNTSISSKKEIEKILDAPIVAEIFKEEGDTSNWIKSASERSVLNEQILNLRNNIRFGLANTNSKCPVILFTSSISGEGKTFLSAYLGNALTYNNKKVVLLELDLRKPKLSKSLGVSNNAGITSYLIGIDTVDQIINKVPDAERLYAISSGPIPPNPIELLESDKMKELFSILKERFDYIIVDTSPIGLVSDAKSLSPFVDYTLFVTRFNYTPEGKLREVAESLDSNIFERIGIIFNGIDVRSSHAYANYSYSAYGYGYGNERNNFTSALSLLRNFRKRFI